MNVVSNQDAIKQYTIRLGDDALVHGHRLSEWCSRGPFLEEDLALSNVALDFIGRARMFYGYAAELSGGTVTEDDLAYLRDCREFTNRLIYELPRGDFAFTMARQFLVDCFNLLFLERLQSSTDATLAAIAVKTLKESRYHSRRSREWMMRLSLGTGQSHARLQTAVNELWGYTPELFASDELERGLAASGVAVDTPTLQAEWQKSVENVFHSIDIELPDTDWQVSGGRQGKHTEWLGYLLCELQFMQRTYPGLQW